MQLTVVDSVFLLYVVLVAISKAMDRAIVQHCLPSLYHRHGILWLHDLWLEKFPHSEY